MVLAPAGAPLVLPEQEEVTLTTPAMSMTLGGVQSAKAQELTDNQWDATAGLPADQAPEVPPDGELQADRAGCSVVATDTFACL
jgi:hypothetical protein